MTRNALLVKPLYLVLLIFFFILHGFAENFFLVSVRDSLYVFSMYLLSACVLLSLFFLVFKHLNKAAFLTLLVLSFNFFFGYVYDGISKRWPGIFFIRYSFMLPFLFVILIVLILVLRKRSFPARVNTYFNVLFSIFILLDIGMLVKKIIARSVTEKSSRQLNVLTDSLQARPDIYLIVADEYGGDKCLKEVCNYDNSDFVGSLRNRHFFVADNSKCNYDFTTFSMASILNMDYPDVDSEKLKEANHVEAMKFILDNRVTAMLKTAGYKVYNYSVFDFKNQPAKRINAFVPSSTSLLTSQTLTDRFNKDVWLNAARIFKLTGVLKTVMLENRKYNEDTYRDAVTITHSNERAPKFVYAHLEMPHFPFYYDSTATPYSDSALFADAPGNIKNYVQYVKYTNSVLLTLTDEILRNNKTPPVIILMSDHGYRCFPEGTVSHAFDNFFSVYLPSKNYAGFTDTTSSVNVFRSVFNSVFNTRFPLLKHRNLHVGN